MKTQILVRSLACLGLIAFVALAYANPGYAQEEKPPPSKERTDVERESPRAGGGGGSGAGGVLVVAPQRMDLVVISYPVLQKGEDAGATTLLLNRPRQFVEAGCYVWRERDGTWLLSCHGETAFDYSVTVTADAEVVLVNTLDPEVNTVLIGENGFSFSGTSGRESKTIRFKAEGTFLEFDIAVSGTHDASRIYLGRGTVNPSQVPFRLEMKAGSTIPQDLEPPNDASGSLESAVQSRGGGGGKKNGR